MAQLFSLDRFQAALTALPQSQTETIARRLTFDVRYVDQLDSTNLDVWRRVDQPEHRTKPGATTIAGSQTAGRGQWSRSWQSDAGGLYLSTLLAPHLPTAEAAQLTFASAWGIAMNLRDRDIPVELKWPNDLLLNGRKLGGILTEIRTQADIITQAVVGVGINWRNSTPETGISLAEFWQTDRAHGSRSPISLELLAAIVLDGIARGFYHWQTHGIEAGTAAYEQLLFHRDRKIRVNQTSMVVLGVTVHGKLRARIQQNGLEGEITFAPGDIQLGYVDYASPRSDSARTIDSDKPVN